ncbi:MAG: hypothetical protein AMK75_04785 [Planctomycetes bacterium SM23_65]|nr:MAG: hypothetical protein AMK75_04785 [Planctomycetes bacterium SM23_65]
MMAHRRCWAWSLLLVAVTVGCGGRGRLDVAKGEREGFETVTVENAEIRVTFLPALGGRVTEYTLKKSGTNQFWVNPEFISPDNVETYYAYGGLDDHLTLEGTSVWPARVPLEPYTCDVKASSDNVTVTLTYENPHWKLERTHVIFPRSTRLHTHETVTNLDNAPRELMPRPHPVFAVGGDADNLDFILQPIGGALLVHRYVEPFGRDVPVPAAGRWAAAVDAGKGEAVVLTFRRDDVDEVNLWYAKDSYNVEPMRSPRRLEKGESLSMAFDMFILSGKDLAGKARALPVEKDVAAEVAAGLDTFSKRKAKLAAAAEADFYLASWGYFRLELPRVFVLDDRLLRLTARLYPLDGGERLPEAKLTLARRDGQEPVELPGPERAPGGNHEVWVFAVPVEKLRDDTYELALATGLEETWSRITQNLVVARELRKKIEASKAAEENTFKPRYAEARFYMEAAHRTGEAAAGSVPAAKSVYAEIEKRLSRSRDALAGKTQEKKTGTFPRFYTSPIDDSAQGYVVHLPLGYTSSRRWPLIVHLHGRDPRFRPFDPELSYHATELLESLSDRFGVVLVRPHGRGNLGYRGAGADDVFTVIERVRADYNIDSNNISLSGTSMGGGGTWSLATRYPGVFSAIGPIFGPTSNWVWAGKRDEQPEWSRFRMDAHSPTSSAENLRYTPVYVYHGVKDPTVSVEHSRRMVARLKEIGTTHIYEEDPQGIHRVPEGLPERVWDFLLEHRLRRPPQTVTLKSPYLRYGKGWWVQMDAFAGPMTFGEIRAEVKARSIEVTQKNLAGFTLELNRSVVSRSKDVTLLIDGHSAFVLDGESSGAVSFHSRSDPDTEKPRWFRGRSPASKPDAPVKNAQLEGPMSDVFRSRFILVVGTAGDDSFDGACRDAAEWFNRTRWRRVQHVDCIIRTDAELTAEDRRDANLVLIGGPEVNAVTREIASKLPLTFEKDGSITIDGKQLRPPGGAVALVYPNPNNVERYVLLFAATTPQATRRILRSADLGFDYHALDERSTDNKETAVLFGVFDQQWTFDRKTQWGRDDKKGS